MSFSMLGSARGLLFELPQALQRIAIGVLEILRTDGAGGVIPGIVVAGSSRPTGIHRGRRGRRSIDCRRTGRHSGRRD